MLKIGCLWIVVQVGDRAWLVRLYGEIIPELQRTNHTLSHLYHNSQCRPCTARSISCYKLSNDIRFKSFEPNALLSKLSQRLPLSFLIRMYEIKI